MRSRYGNAIRAATENSGFHTSQCGLTTAPAFPKYLGQADCSLWIDGWDQRTYEFNPHCHS